MGFDELKRPAWPKSSYSGGNGGTFVEVADNVPGPAV